MSTPKGLPQNNFNFLNIDGSGAGGTEFSPDDIKNYTPPDSEGDSDISSFLNYVDRITELPLNRNYVISSEFETSDDPIRLSLERYWVDRASEIHFNKQYIPSKIKFESVEPQSADILNFENGNVYNGFAQTITVSRTTSLEDLATDAASISPTENFQNTSGFFQALEEIQESKLIETIEIYNYDCKKPVEYPSRHGSEANIGRPVVDVQYIYNYELTNYEQYCSDSSVTEGDLLNYYNDYDKIRGTETSVIFSTPEPGTYIGGFSKKDNTKKEKDQEFVDITRNKESADQNIIVTEEGLKKIQDDNDGMLSLPFYVKIDINKPKHAKKNELSEEISKTIFSNNKISTKMDIPKSSRAPKVKNSSYVAFHDDGICDRIANYCLQLTSPTANPELFKKRDFSYSYLDANYKNEYQDEVEYQKQIGSESIFLFDALSMAENLDRDSVSLNSSPQQVSLIGSDNLTVNGLKTSLLKNEFEKLLDGSQTPKLQNAYLEILSGDANYFSTDIILYKISKFDENDLDNPIQNIFIPCKNDKQISYIDFQVKYGKRYTYKIYAYKFISGTNYTLSVSKATDSSLFSSYIKEYERKKNEMLVQAKFSSLKNLTDEDKKRMLENTVNGYKSLKQTPPGEKNYYSYSGNFDRALTNFQEDLQEVLNEGNKISQKSENLSSMEPRSAQLRLAIKALQSIQKSCFGGLTESFSSDFLLTSLLKEIENRMPPTMVAITVDSSTMSQESKEKLESAKSSIETYRSELSNLIAVLRDVLTDKNGLGKNPLPRKLRAAELLVSIERFFDFEEEMIDQIAEVLRSDADASFDQNAKDITGFTYPTIQLFEIPYYENSGAILDNPPVFPDINFIPYKGNSKNISFFISSGVGEIIDTPVIFDDKEREYYNLWRESKKYNQVEPIPFITDEIKNLGSSFEIYRVSEPPREYLDFQNYLYQVVSEKFKGGKESLPSVSFLEKIKPNKTYYYMFRLRDSRGVVSNPSSVFSVLLVDEGGLIFPIIELYEFPEKEKNYSTSLRKLLNLSPSINQITPEAEEIGSFTSIDNVEKFMGVQDKQLFGKKFKIRFTSKKTGKQIDLNVTFNAKLI